MPLETTRVKKEKRKGGGLGTKQKGLQVIHYEGGGQKESIFSKGRKKRKRMQFHMEFVPGRKENNEHGFFSEGKKREKEKGGRQTLNEMRGFFDKKKKKRDSRVGPSHP